jgi:hypothetical protein
MTKEAWVSKSEIRNPKEARMTNAETHKRGQASMINPGTTTTNHERRSPTAASPRHSAFGSRSDFGFRVSDLFRISDFGFRISASSALLCCFLALAFPSFASAQSPFVTQGGEYGITGPLPGDQVHSQLALKPSGGFLVWEDNFTDGDGLGISALRLDSSFSGTFSSFRVNQIGAGDQERPRVSLLNGGGAAFVWQGGRQGFQNIYARFLSAANTWVGNDVLVNTYTNKAKVNPAVATLVNGNVVVVWGSFNQISSNSFQDVYAQLLSPSGQKLGGEFLINLFTSFNQRTPAVAALAGGGFAVAWVSEQQRANDSSGGVPSVDVYARLFDSGGSATSGEILVNTGTNVCANPSLAASSDGGFMAAWGEKDSIVVSNSWDILARPFSSSGSGGTARRVNTRLVGDQFGPQLSASGTDYLLVWTSLGQDGSGEGVFGQFLRSDGSLSGSELRVNTTVINPQIHPCLGSDGVGRFLAAWSSYVGGVNSFDLYAQRYVNTNQALGAPAPPFVTVLGSNSLSVTWPPVAGFSIADYEVYADGAAAGAPSAVLTNTWWTMTGLAPSSTHYFQLAYVLTDGRRSPLSGPTTNSTYSASPTWGGIPQEWMAFYFGNDIFAWPSPYADSDGDGASNLNEFLAGTDPTNANSVMRIRLQQTHQGLYLNWNTQPGLIYQVQTSGNLTSWSALGSPRFAAGSLDSLYVGGSNKGYYRIVRLR